MNGEYRWEIVARGEKAKLVAGWEKAKLADTASRGKRSLLSCCDNNGNNGNNVNNDGQATNKYKLFGNNRPLQTQN